MPFLDAISSYVDHKQGNLPQTIHHDKISYGTTHKRRLPDGNPHRSRGVAQCGRKSTPAEVLRVSNIEDLSFDILAWTRGNMTCIMSRGKKPGRRCVYDETQGPLEPWVPCKGDEIPKLGGFEEIGNLKRQDLSVFMIPESLHAEIKQPNASRQLSSTTPDLTAQRL